jgi:hypothetical protein
MKRESEEDAAGGAFSPVVSVGEAMDAIAVPKYDGIAILGSHPHTKRLAPCYPGGQFADKKWLIYACSPDNSPHGFSEHAAAPPHVDVWFENHVPVFDKTRPYGYLDWLRSMPKVWMRDEVAMRMRSETGEKLFPNAELFPEAEIKGEFCPFLFTSSIAYILAMAIMDAERLGIRRIGLWGILQASEQEYGYQRSGTQYFLWEAARRGIQVMVAKKSRLFEAPPEIW